MEMKRVPKHSLFMQNGAYISCGAVGGAAGGAPCGSSENETGGTLIHTDIPFLEKALRGAFKAVHPAAASYGAVWLLPNVPNSVKEETRKIFQVDFSADPDAYAIVADINADNSTDIDADIDTDIDADADNDIRIYSNSERGLIYGVFELIRLADDCFFPGGFLYDAPACPVRGAKVYLPGRAGIPYFLEFIDFLVHFRFNTLMIEIGGAMEYKRHPEINEGWVEYCKEIAEYSGKASDIQDKIYPWLKNSIHVENGEGGFITQGEVRMIADYCRERRIEIVPEVPCFSHCDYLLTRHPEIRERADDDYADTYCPSNEKSYELLFDILDEVIDVFNPAMINIGHDEAYTIGVCPDCEKKDPVQIYAGDVRRIYDYLKDKSIKTMMWGEKFLNARSAGKPQGGAEKFIHYYSNKPLDKPIPATYPAIDIVPKDLEMLHWYWGIDEAYDEEYLKRGFSVTYGNFSPVRFKNWRIRMERGINNGIMGGIKGDIKGDIKGGIISNWSSIKEENVQRNGMLFQIAFANQLFWEDDFSAEMEETFRMWAYRELYDYKYKETLGGAYIKITHSTDFYLEYLLFYDGYFIEQEKYDLGYYEVKFGDGRTAALPISYGRNIGSFRQPWDLADQKLAEVTYSTLPQQVCGGVVYETIYVNPFPEAGITAVAYIPNPKNKATVTLHKFETG